LVVEVDHAAIAESARRVLADLVRTATYRSR
jgi:hypothetical protein